LFRTDGPRVFRNGPVQAGRGGPISDARFPAYGWVTTEAEARTGVQDGSTPKRRKSKFDQALGRDRKRATVGEAKANLYRGDHSMRPHKNGHSWAGANIVSIWGGRQGILMRGGDPSMGFGHMNLGKPRNIRTTSYWGCAKARTERLFGARTALGGERRAFYAAQAGPGLDEPLLRGHLLVQRDRGLLRGGSFLEQTGGRRAGGGPQTGAGRRPWGRSNLRNTPRASKCGRGRRWPARGPIAVRVRRQLFRASRHPYRDGLQVTRAGLDPDAGSSSRAPRIWPGSWGFDQLRRTVAAGKQEKREC